MNENLDLTKILKDCPEGTKLYSPIFGDVELVSVSRNEEAVYPIEIKKSNNALDSFTKDGRLYTDYVGECMLFPSKDQRDWSEFTAPWYKKDKLVEPKFKVGDWIITPTNKVLQITSIEGTSYRFNNKSHYWAICYCDEECRLWTIQDAKDGDILSYQCGYLKNRTIYIYRYNKIMNTAYYVALSGDNDSTFKIDNRGVCSLNGYGSTARFATEEEKQKLFDAIKENGYKWNAETKTLEKLIQPKFKVGDMVRHKKANKDDVYEIGKVYDDSYGIVGFSWMIYMKYQDQYELIPNKFDPKTLQPFDKVLIRRGSENYNVWFPDFVSDPPNNDNNKTLCMCVGEDIAMVIPYNDETKHLIGTTDEAPEFYRYWEE